MVTLSRTFLASLRLSISLVRLSPRYISAFPLTYLPKAIMNYDVFGSWAANTGPNAPLKDSCAPAADQVGSAESAVAAWTGAGFPAIQLLLGVAAYGRSFRVAPSAAKTSSGSLNAYAAFDKTNIPLGEGETSSTPVANKCGILEGPGGVWTFKGMIENGFLGPDGNPAEGIDYTFDECSQTVSRSWSPFVYGCRP
jgi:chitinase